MLVFPFDILHEVFYVVLCMCRGHCSLFYSSFPHPDEKHFTNEAFQQRIKVPPPEKNLVDPERALSRCNAGSLLLRGQDRIQADVDVLFLPAEFKCLDTRIFYGKAVTKKCHKNSWFIVDTIFPPFNIFLESFHMPWLNCAYHLVLSWQQHCQSLIKRLSLPIHMLPLGLFFGHIIKS